MALPRPARVAAASRDRFDVWLQHAEAQLGAALRADPVALETTTEARRVFQVELARQPLLALPATERAHAAGVAKRIRAIDQRIHACGEAALGLLGGLLPDAAPSTYGRRGLLRGV